MKSYLEKLSEYITKKGKSNLFVTIGLVGILLIFISDMDLSGSKQKDSTENETLHQYKTELEREITVLLKEIDGVGNVKVMITLESGSENIYVQQEKTANDSSSHNTENNIQQNKKSTFENEIVIVADGGENQALVEKTLQPVVQGIAVVCSGADDIKVVSAVTNSVSVVLNLPTHKICVTKMR